MVERVGERGESRLQNCARRSYGIPTASGHPRVDGRVCPQRVAPPMGLDEAMTSPCAVLHEWGSTMLCRLNTHTCLVLVLPIGPDEIGIPRVVGALSGGPCEESMLRG